MCVKQNVTAEAVAGFPNMARDSGVAVCPCIADVTGVIVHGHSPVNHPSPSDSPAVWSDDRQKWNPVVYRVIQWDWLGFHLR